MNGFEVHDQMGENGSMHFRVLRTLMTSYLPVLQSSLYRKAQGAFQVELAASDRRADGWTGIPTFPMAKKVVGTVNSFMFFGEELTNNSEFMQAALRYPQDVFVAGEALRFTPAFLAPTVAALVTSRNWASKTLVKHLTPLVEKRLQSRGALDSQPQHLKPLDCVQWVIDSSPRKNPWTRTKIIQEILALWFGSVHQLAMTFVYALYDLCTFPEYVVPLREELENQLQHKHGQVGELQLDNLPLLDSFLRESARMRPSDCISVRRKALRPFAFSDGIRVDAGNWACVPQRAIMQDPALYPGGMAFDGFRFTGPVDRIDKDQRPVPNKRAEEPGATPAKPGVKYTEINSKFPFWGLGKHA
ncbi:MAG: ADP-ribosylation factor protein 3, partial [Sclerophora amabilis]